MSLPQYMRYLFLLLIFLRVCIKIQSNFQNLSLNLLLKRVCHFNILLHQNIVLAAL